MCGIAGLVRKDQLSPDDGSAVRMMTSAQAHRGPAAEGYCTAGVVALGHRRLSIIDVSAAGNQPMSNEDGSVRVTYNGEIYNHEDLRAELRAFGHTFQSRADTEVIVHGYEQWGIDGLVKRLRGMFAFGLFDARLGLILARDRLGIKPLYYWLDDDRGFLLFASEVRAILASGYVQRQTDPRALTGFLLTGSVPAPATVIRNVHCLLPGHYLSWRNGDVTTRKYWDFSSDEPSEPGTLKEVRSLLEDSVARHLMSDVPLGVFLSGGVDSGALVALATRARPQSATPLKTLTVVFDEQEFSEAREARDVAELFGTDHQEVRVTRAEFDREVPAILSAMDQPTHDGVNTWFVSKAARRAGLTVVLSGLGGDEVFWGYKHYRWLSGPARWLTHLPTTARRMLTTSASTYGRIAGRENWMRMAFLEHGASTREMYLMMRGFFAPQQVARLLDLTSREVNDAAERFSAPSIDGGGAVPFNQLEFRRYLHDQLLRDADVFSMAHSIETRVPFLDHLLVEHVGLIRADHRMGNGINKPLLVHALNEPLLSRFGAAPKRGFSFPMDRWMKASAGQLEEMATGGHVLNRKEVRSHWKSFRAGNLHWSRAWALSVVGATVH